jgi:thioredoxin 1
MAHLTFEVTTGSFSEEVLNAEQPILVEFGADWCPPCKMLAPILDDLARKYEGKMRIATVDADTDPQLIETYGVMGLPTLILFREGQAVQRVVGYQPRERLEAALLPHLATETV